MTTSKHKGNILDPIFSHPVSVYLLFLFFFVLVDLPHFTWKGFWCKVVLVGLCLLVGGYMHKNMVQTETQGGE